MPVHFQFTDKITGELVPLEKVDAEMCRDEEIPVHPTLFSNMFWFCQTIGTSSSVQNSSGEVDREKLQARLEKVHSEMPQKEKNLVVKFLCDKYTFSSWWSPKS